MSAAIYKMSQLINNKAHQSSLASWMRYAEKQMQAEIESLITQEILICHHENTPTSRLTSLLMAMKKKYDA